MAASMWLQLCLTPTQWSRMLQRLPAGDSKYRRSRVQIEVEDKPAKELEVEVLGLVAELISRGADVHPHPQCLRSPLVKAVRSGSTRLVNLLIDAGAHVDALDGSGSFPLESAVEKRGPYFLTTQQDVALATVRLLLERGANPNQRTRDQQRSALWIVCAAPKVRDRMVILQALLDHGADPNLTTSTGLTPLGEAVRRKNVDLCYELLRRGASPEGSIFNNLHLFWMRTNEGSLISLIALLASRIGPVFTTSSTFSRRAWFPSASSGLSKSLSEEAPT
ncbi:ankyrin repeat-containing domain protein [Microdochium bolleyi]|uniref:Ankyrin repeat-containing domain protein n=1 Tax=Microdochium bolleyi TaxID=196109 RepID=A0A136IKH6_9PEZI|nr:ankyrin repeat-containing domain protein [Microdochium bolleyi]